LKISISRIGVLVWVFIYGGLLVFAMGLALRDYNDPVAHGLAGLGLLVAAIGVYLIFLRARILARSGDAKPSALVPMPDPPESLP
jgi:hypothetical protein